MKAELHPEAWLDRLGELTDDERASLEHHAESCAECRLELRVRAEARAEQKSTAGAVGVDHAVERALARLHADRTPRHPWLRHAAGFLIGAGSAATVLGAFVGLTGIDGERRAERPTPGRAQAVSAMERDDPTQPSVAPRPVPPVASPLTPEPTPDPALARTPQAATMKSAPGSDTDAPPTQTAPSMFAAAIRARQTGAYEDAVGLFERTSVSFPRSREGMTSLVLAARIKLEQLSDPAGALELYDRYLERAQGGTLRPEAMAGRVRALARLGRHGDAEAARNELLRHYPTSAPARNLQESR